jgi:hypothetical protein
LRDDNVAACVFSISCSESVEKAFGTHFCPQGHLRKQKAIRHDILGAGVVRVFAAYGEFIYYLCPREWVGIWQGNWGKTN